MARRDPYIVGLDVGTTKVCAVVGEPTDDNTLEIIGVGVADSHGQKKGAGVDVDSTVESIKSAVEEAELMAGTSVDRAYVGIAGGHIRGFNSRGAVTVNGRARQITEEDIRRVIDAARALDLPPDRELLHLLPREFAVDEQGDIVDPLGMSGRRLEVDVHLVVGALSAIQTLVTCVNRAGIEAHAVVLEQLAANEAVLTDDLLPRGRLCEILQPRAIEILDLVADELNRAGFLDQLNAGLVLTGGGSLVEGFPELTEQRFGLPVRCGQPIGVEGLVDIVSSPIYSTAVGLVLYGHYNRDRVTYFGSAAGGLFSRLGGRVSSWLGDLF